MYFSVFFCSKQAFPLESQPTDRKTFSIFLKLCLLTTENKLAMCTRSYTDGPATKHVSAKDDGNNKLRLKRVAREGEGVGRRG